MDLEPQTGRQQHKDSPRRPGMRRAGHWIERRTFARPTWKPTKQLRHPGQVKVCAGVEQVIKNGCRLRFETVAREAPSHERVVVWPDRAIVVRHGVVET